MASIDPRVFWQPGSILLPWTAVVFEPSSSSLYIFTLAIFNWFCTVQNNRIREASSGVRIFLTRDRFLRGSRRLGIIYDVAERSVNGVVSYWLQSKFLRDWLQSDVQTGESMRYEIMQMTRRRDWDEWTVMRGSKTERHGVAGARSHRCQSW